MTPTDTRCPYCGGWVYRSSTPTTDGPRSKTFTRHRETGFSTCSEELASRDPWAGVETVERGPRDRDNTYRGKVTR